MNQLEVQVRNHLEQEGWSVLNKGWPDFLCIRGRELKAVEVKPQQGSGTTPHQDEVLVALGQYFRTEVWFAGSEGAQISDYSSPKIADQIAKIRSFEGLGVS